MKKTFLVLSLVGGIALINVWLTRSGCKNQTATEHAGMPDSITNAYAAVPLKIDSLSQRQADIFSWRSFIAMCWPADLQTCGPDTSAGHSILNGNGPVVWETYLTSDQVFVSAPNQPDSWCSQLLGATSFKSLPKSVQDLATKTGIHRILHRTSKSPHALGQASGQPLVDQNQRFVRYEVRMNMDEYNYIVQNNLWNAAGQTSFANSNTINFPDTASQYGQVGAMEIKAAWKVMGANDDRSRFYTIKAIVYNDDQLDTVPGVDTVTFGLVGLHIAHKVKNQDNWVWSTFEQVDNLTKSFNNPACPASQCPPNTPPDTPYVEFNKQGQLNNQPTQVTRVNPVVDPFVAAINQRYQNMLKGSVWANYQLISTQWLFSETMTPLYLANSVQETYLQGPHPDTFGDFALKPGFDVQYYTDPRYQPFSAGSSSSCMGCHYKALTTNPDTTKRGDFSFLLGEAH